MPRKAVHEHELTSLSTDDSDRLLESQPAGKTASSDPTSNSRIRDFLRHVRLLLPAVLIGRAFSWMSPIEQRKVAAYQSRRMAILNSLLHLVPLLGATSLLVLFWTKHWVGGTSDNSTTLQFVAKFHELLMQASLVNVLLYIIRAQALEGYIPLGVLSGAAQAPQISYLWSLDFISALKSPYFLWWRRIIFALSSAVLLFMASVVGPSSAVLMIPRPDMTYVHSEITSREYLPEDYLFPTEINSTHGLNFSRWGQLEGYNKLLSYGNSPEGSTYLWPSAEQFFSKNGESNRLGHMNEMVMWSSRYSYDYRYDVPIVVTLPTDLAAWQILDVCTICPLETQVGPSENEEIKGSVAVRTFQPIVSSTCHNVRSGTLDGLGEWVYYPARNESLGHLSSFLETEKAFWHGLTEESFKLASPVWMAAPDDPESLVVVLLASLGYGLGYTLVSCTISSYWWLTDASLEFVPKPRRLRLEVKAPPLTRSGALAKTSNMRRITFDPTNIESLNSIDFTGKITGNTPAALPMFWISVLGSLSLNETNLYWQSLNEEEKQSPPLGASYTVTNMLYGFGYGSTDTPSKLAAAVITAYCLISLLFICYIMITGHTSIVWDSAMELIVLALQSKEPDGLGHVSVGLDSMDTFRRTVGIRVNTVPAGDTGENMERLELVFEHDEDTDKRGLTKIVRNRAY